MGPSRTISKINGDFNRKSQNFHTPCILRTYWRELELGIGARVRKQLEWWGYRAEKEVWRYLHPSGYNPPTCQTDRRTDRHRTTAKTVLTHSDARLKCLITVNVHKDAMFFFYKDKFTLCLKCPPSAEMPCFESWMPLVNECINCALFNTVSKVYLHNWK